MSTLATHVNTIITNSLPQYVISEYSLTGIGSDSTSELYEIELFAPSSSSVNFRNVPNLLSNGQSYAVQLCRGSVSCLSRDFNVSLLNKDDISLLNTINVVASYSNVNLVVRDQIYGYFIVRNRDTILTNSLYVFVENSDTIATGDIRLEIVYIPIHYNSVF